MNNFTHWVRSKLGINEDLQNIAKDMKALANSLGKTNEDVFTIFHGLPFTAGVLTLTAADAAKFINPQIGERNALVPLLTAIVIATRQGQSSLEVHGELSDTVRKLLEKRGFKVEEIQGSNNNKGLFILWT